MKTKLTLSLEEDILRRAKKFANNQKKSLSALVSEMLNERIEQSENQKAKTAAHNRLAGSITLSEEWDEDALDDLRYQALKEKHGL